MAASGSARQGGGDGFPWPRAGECRWPEGDPSTDDLTFCKAPAAKGRPYCEEHCARAYQKATAKDAQGSRGSRKARRRAREAGGRAA